MLFNKIKIDQKYLKEKFEINEIHPEKKQEEPDKPIDSNTNENQAESEKIIANEGIEKEDEKNNEVDNKDNLENNNDDQNANENPANLEDNPKNENNNENLIGTEGKEGKEENNENNVDNQNKDIQETNEPLEQKAEEDENQKMI